MLLPAAALAAALQVQAAVPARTIQIGIAPHADAVTLIFHGAYRAVDAAGGARVLPSGKRLTLAPDGRGVSLGGFWMAAPVRVASREEGASAELAGKRYGGALLLRLDSGGDTVTVVDEISIERYLLGVLPFEMDPQWPQQALRAQAVVARTFAYTQLGKYRKEGFDLSDDTRSQVFGGLGADTPAVRQAVEATRGEVLGYKGKILDVYYHSCCGGHTESPATLWGGGASPPLRGVRDRYCEASPYASWSAFVTFDHLAASLQKNRLTGGKLERFAVEARDAAGYVSSFIARLGREKLMVKASDLRAALGAERLKSLRIRKVRLLKNGVEFDGAGSGHGVGLCQWGARIQAGRGRTYEQILSFYFPGSTLSVLDD